MQIRVLEFIRMCITISRKQTSLLTAWYWGTITGKRRKGQSRYHSYSVEFDDKDFLEEISALHLMGVDEYRSLEGLGFWDDQSLQEESDKASAKGKNGQRGSQETKAYTPQQLYLRRCKKCVQCRKPECGKCQVCMQMERARGRKKASECCYQKVN